MGLLDVFLPLSMNSVLLITSIILFVWYYFNEKCNYWKKRSVTHISPARCWLEERRLQSQQKQFMYGINGWYEKFEGHKYVGIYQLLQPALLIRDPELIKLTLVKAFTNFHDRNPPKDDNMMSGNIAELTGKEWHQLRQKVSPGFSSAKMKIMYDCLKEGAQELNSYLGELCAETGETEFEAKELMSNYTLDVIGAIAMGIKCNAIRDPNCEIKRFVDRLFRFDRRRYFYFMLELIHPKLPKWCGLQMVDHDVGVFLWTICQDTIQMKKKDASSKRRDFLQIMMNIRNSDEEKMGKSVKNSTGEVSKDIEGPIITEKVMTGIMGTFLSAGFEPIASTLSFCLYELALHPEIQDKLFKEIQAVKNQVGDDVGYEDLKKFPYTDQVINETLRKYPVATMLVRYCTEPFKLPDSSVVLEKGVRLIIPTYAIHHDPKYFPEPEKFNPDRFSDENINKIVPGTYLPFGDGPRFCIAMRLALLDVKTMLITMVSNYYLSACAKTQKNMQFDTTFFTLSPKDGLFLQLHKRK